MKRDEAVKLVETGFEELAASLKAGKSDKLKEWMAVCAKFSNYSLRNCLLISQQKPDASQVAGFRKWPKLGRQVKKGEKGIAIFAPLVYKKKDDSKPPPSEDENGKRELRGFKVVHVFDISQTEGDDLPEPHTVGGEPGPWVAKLETIIAAAGIELEESDDLGGADGMSTKGRIVVAKGLSPANRFSVLVHELCHEETHSKSVRKGTTKKSRETEAEAVACIVAQAVGLDANQSASDYIQLYAGDVETLTASLDVIQKEACSIIERLHSMEVATALPNQGELASEASPTA